MITAFEEKEPNIFSIKAAKVNSASYGWDGTKYTFSKEALEKYAHTWAGGIVTLNHMYIDHQDSMIREASFGSDDMVDMNIAIGNEETAKRIRAKEPTGVSIEASSVGDTPDNEIMAFTGTGVSIIFYPEQPACPTEDGCGIVSKTISNSPNNTDGNILNGEKLSADTTTLSGVETTLSGGINISETDPEPNVTPGSTPANEPGGVVSQEDFQKISAKLIETRQELAELKSAGVTKEYTDQIETKDKQIATLQSEIDTRDSAIAASVVEEILKLDPEFEVEGKSLSDLQIFHASLSRMAAKIQSKEDPDPNPNLAGATFTAPHTEEKKDSLTIGGIVAGQWTGGNGRKPNSAVAPLAGD